MYLPLERSDSFHGFGYTFWTFWIIALHLLYKLWISNILATSITEGNVLSKFGVGKLVPLMLLQLNLTQLSFNTSLMEKYKHLLDTCQTCIHLFHVKLTIVSREESNLKSI